MQLSNRIIGSLIQPKLTHWIIILLIAKSPLSIGATSSDCKLLSVEQIAASCEEIFAGDNIGAKPTVSAIQQALNDLGFPAGFVDGFAGENTTSALNAFYAQTGLAPRETYDKETLGDILDQFKLSIAAQSMFEESKAALSAGNLESASIQLKLARSLSNLVRPPQDLVDEIETESQKMELEVQPQSLEEAKNDTETLEEKDEPGAIRNNIAETSPQNKIPRDKTTDDEAKKSEQTNTTHKTLVLLEAANGLQLSYQDKIDGREKYHRDLILSIESLFSQ